MMRRGTKPEGPIECPAGLSSDDSAILQFILDNVPAPARHAARNAVHNLGLAEKLGAIDLNMAAFRAITAEEEAATALFHSLSRRRYPNAERLRPRDHRHKNAVAPFLDGIRACLGRAEQLGTIIVQLQIPTAGHPKKQPRIEIWTPQVPIGRRLTPIPPLGFNISVNNELHDFREEFAKIASERGIDSAETYVRHRANQRNQILYASSEGIPRVAQLNDFLGAQRKRVFQILTALVFVDPYSEHQLFVQQCLDAFLAIVVGLQERVPETQAAVDESVVGVSERSEQAAPLDAQNDACQ